LTSFSSSIRRVKGKIGANGFPGHPFNAFSPPNEFGASCGKNMGTTERFDLISFPKNVGRECRINFLQFIATIQAKPFFTVNIVSNVTKVTFPIIV
jgi:hypothetical protein